MKKNLLAIAVGAAVAMPVVALADGPTVYGKVNVSLENSTDEVEALFDYLDGAAVPTIEEANTAISDAEDVWALNSNASRLGVKGDFDLDVANLKAIYQLEYEIAVDDGDAVFKQRNIFGGFKGAFGTLKAGMFDTPTKKAQGKIDQFNDIGGDIKNILSGENRSKNIIQYSTPALADIVTLNAAFIPAEGADLDNDGKPETGLADTLSVSLVAEKDLFFGAISHDSDMVDELSVDETGNSTTIDITRVAVGLKPGNFEFGALYQMAEETESLPGVDKGEETSVVLSGAMKIDRVKLKAQYGMTEGDVFKDELTQWSLGADYKLAKASKVYAYYSNLELAIDDAPGLDDPIADTFGIGMEHKF